MNNNERTRFDSLPIDQEQINDIGIIKGCTEDLAIIIGSIEMDDRLRARANSALEDCVLYAVKGVSRRK